MRKLAIMAALSSTALATPAVARDNSWYVRVDGGVMLVGDTRLDLNTDDAELIEDIDDALVINHSTGIDLDLVGGYDFGGFRIEGEIAWKRAGMDDVAVDGALIDDISVVIQDVDGSVSVLSAMV